MSLRCGSRWGARLIDSGATQRVEAAWKTLRSAVVQHQELLRAEGIGQQVQERDRIRVNARRVGLEAPAFADELSFISVSQTPGPEGTDNTLHDQVSECTTTASGEAPESGFVAGQR